ncbi:Tab2/Atab2 family RNA-binding protein [Trichothermofontia sichuanensis B231]|uniref:Tab2/Atab2 family RNA-binding protein n=1 Tax=Trichothermofontia sichuanensis TaxID=3045816 RepID=UPI0022452370|nr:Tab2/Atab2 family RNA-binding protein [Trichothermofontia sichuanensis]UZQ54970.1 Tab2/Atab2 family RNA-binding protein [Trichothermofontia sichuanensis B231]
MNTIWELDFYSRPIVDENNKKRWEMLVCESPLTPNRSLDSLFRYSQFCDSSQVNSIWLKAALEAAIAKAEQPPDKIRFFRRQMTNMISRACGELNIPAIASRRTFALWAWLKQREADFYLQQPGYQPGQSPSVQMQPGAAQRLPDALRGEQWRFVSLEAAAFADMADWAIDFGEVFPLALVDLAPNTPIPGLIIYSTRALPLAAWLSGLEVASLQVEGTPPTGLVLQTGASDQWLLVSLRDPTVQQEAQAFEISKKNAQNVHFLAVQSGPESEAFAGFWLLQSLDLP